MAQSVGGSWTMIGAGHGGYTEVCIRSGIRDMLPNRQSHMGRKACKILPLGASPCHVEDTGEAFTRPSAAYTAHRWHGSSHFRWRRHSKPPGVRILRFSPFCTSSRSWHCVSEFQVYLHTMVQVPAHPLCSTSYPLCSTSIQQ